MSFCVTSDDESDIYDYDIPEQEESIQDICLSNSYDEDIVFVSKIEYKKDIDDIDITFKLESLSLNIQKSMKHMMEVLEDRKNTNIRINNQYSITSDQCRVQYVDKINKNLILNIMLDPKRQEGLDIVVIKSNKNSSNITPVLFDRYSRYNERIRIWDINNTYINAWRSIHYINGVFNKLNIYIVKDVELIDEIKNKCKLSCLPKIFYTDPIVLYIGAIINDIICIEDDISINYKYVSIPRIKKIKNTDK